MADRARGEPDSGTRGAAVVPVVVTGIGSTAFTFVINLPAGLSCQRGIDSSSALAILGTKLNTITPPIVRMLDNRFRRTTTIRGSPLPGASHDIVHGM